MIRLRPGWSVFCILAWARERGALLNVHIVSGVHSASYSMGTRVLFLGKGAGAWCWSRCPYSADVKNDWSCTSASRKRLTFILFEGKTTYKATVLRSNDNDGIFRHNESDEIFSPYDSHLADRESISVQMPWHELLWTLLLIYLNFYYIWYQSWIHWWHIKKSWLQAVISVISVNV